MTEYKNLIEDIRSDVDRQMDMSREMNDEEIGNIIDDAIMKKSRQIYMSAAAKLNLRQDLFNSIRRLGLLQELIDDGEITEIMVNGPENIYYEKQGVIFRWDKCFESRQQLEDIIQQIVSRSNRYVNESVPIVDARLEDGSRVNVVLDPVALNGPILTIRKFPEKAISMEDLINWGSISREAAEYLKVLVRAGYNIFISGGTGSGKTTFLNILAGFLPAGCRVITIEDSAELQLQNVTNLVRLEARQADQEGSSSVTIRDLIKTSLRMRPDCLIVGEVRGAEALDMIQAMNTGADSLSTGHANSSKDMLSRLETMVLMGTDIPMQSIRSQIGSSIDILVHLGRLRDHSRRVLEITELEGYEDGKYMLNPLFRFRELHELAGEEIIYGGRRLDEVDGQLERTGNKLLNRQKLEASALILQEGYPERYSQ